VNVRPLTPDGGGTLLPFRHQRGEGTDPAEPDADETTSRLPASPGSLGSPGSLASPTVVDLRRAREAARAAPRGRRPGGSVWARRAVVASCAVALVGGAAAAALTGALPLSSEQADRRPAVSAPPTTAGGTEGDLPAAYGLCTAFDRAAERGDDVATSVAFRNLSQAAGGATRVSAYCAPYDELARGRAR
jgi:hypothetical protein